MKQRSSETATWKSWSSGFETSEIRAAIDRIRRWPDVERVVTLPDIHLAGKTCNGVVVATRERIYPAAIGADIGCGMSTLPLKTDVDIWGNDDLRLAILRSWRRGIPILKSGASNRDEMPDSGALTAPALQHSADRDGRYQLGTLGRGNHFLELQIDEEGDYWLLIHSGSRAMGQAVTAFHESQSVASQRQVFLEAHSQSGQNYQSDLTWCRQYASASRRAILRRAVELIAEFITVNADLNAVQETDHNHLESHDGLLVHRKGAQRIREGAWGVIPGSMATATYHVEGRGSAAALDSCSHGAGRQLTRTKAVQSLSSREVRRSLAEVTCDEMSISHLIDEAPAVYRDIEAVLRSQRDLVKRTRRLRPLLTLKGGR
jgi:tRNA-splicing ligase RtcB (3'-phosphate/5'-hydroxy nucleic acid ligase)